MKFKPKLPAPRKPNKFTTKPGNNGHFSAYEQSYDKQVKQLALLGLIGDQIAKYFEITEATLYNWIKQNPSFAAALKEGREQADANVAESLYKKAIGYELEQFKVVMGEDGRPIVVPYLERHGPDAWAANKWLNNRQRGLWAATPLEPLPVQPTIQLTLNSVSAVDAAAAYARFIASN